MKKIISKIIIGVILAVAAVVFVYFLFHPLIYYARYFEKLGIKNAYASYTDIVHDKGKTEKTVVKGDELYAYYDGLNLVFYESVNNYYLARVEVTGKQYRFGIWSLGVGSDRKKVESVYRNVRKSTGRPKNEFGAIEGFTWVDYDFDANNKVKEIHIYYGP